MLDADIRGFFDTIDHKRMLRFIGHRISDPRIRPLVWCANGSGLASPRMANGPARESGHRKGLLHRRYLRRSIYTMSWINGRSTGGTNAPEATSSLCAMPMILFLDSNIVMKPNGFLSISSHGWNTSVLPYIRKRPGLSNSAGLPAIRGDNAGKASRTRSTSPGFTHICVKTRLRKWFHVWRKTI